MSGSAATSSGPVLGAAADGGRNIAIEGWERITAQVLSWKPCGKAGTGAQASTALLPAPLSKIKQPQHSKRAAPVSKATCTEEMGCDTWEQSSLFCALVLINTLEQPAWPPGLAVQVQTHLQGSG